MDKNKKDYIVYTIGMQIIVCLILFGAAFGLKKTNSDIYKTVKEEFFDNVDKNIKIDEYIPSGTVRSDEETTSTELTPETTGSAPQTPNDNDTTHKPTSMLTAVVNAKGGNEYDLNDDGTLPNNVSVDDYTLSQNMYLPVTGTTSSEFGERIHPISGNKRFHAGIDIAASLGTSVYAAFDGTVVVAGYDQWNGNHIKIIHENNIMTVYCHCEKLLVNKGDKVKAGQKIGLVGSTGSSTGPHLHFELRINNVSYNPQKALENAINEV